MTSSGSLLTRYSLDIMVEAGYAAGEVDNTRENKYRQILGLKTVHLLSIWSLIYVGVEVTLGGKYSFTNRNPPPRSDARGILGWIVTFIEQKRGGDASAGYISSGFFGGRLCSEKMGNNT